MIEATTTSEEALLDTRLQLHWATQIADGFGKAHAEKHPLWHHAALRFDDGLWQTAPAAGTDVRLGIHLGEGTLSIRSEHDPQRCSLNGKTLEGVRDWAAEQALAHGIDGSIPLRDPEQMPAHDVGTGSRFALDPVAATWWHALYVRAAQALQERSARYKDAAPCLLWPHHFDVSTMRTLEEKEGGEDARTLTLGFSPGDASYDEPYWYVTPWPYPEDLDLPELTLGRWHTEGWIGAVLVHSAVNAAVDVDTFLDAASSAAEPLLA